MKFRYFLILIVSYMFSFVSWAQMPNCFEQKKNEINSFIDVSLSGPILLDQDLEIIWSAIQEAYSVDLQNLNLNLKLEEKNSAEIGAWADLQDTKAVIVVSRANRFHRKMNSATVTLILCHELGHFLGGLPRYSNSSWASVEGQADYFATASCVPAIYNKIAAKLTKSFAVKDEVKNYCRSTLLDLPLNFCEYALEGAYSLIQILSPFHVIESQSSLSIQSRDLSISTQLIESHASLSCRYETFLRGLLTLERPSCWFSPLM